VFLSANDLDKSRAVYVFIFLNRHNQKNQSATSAASNAVVYEDPSTIKVYTSLSPATRELSPPVYEQLNDGTKNSAKTGKNDA
jgi:hypothetical protein